MRSSFVIWAFVVLLFGGTAAVFYCGTSIQTVSVQTIPVPSTEEEVAPQAVYTRIVSLAPSITEQLFALGLGDRVVGVTQFCDFPSEAQELPQVGGYLDPSYEAILGLAPDVVVLLEVHGEALDKLKRLHVPTLPISHGTTDDILESFISLGEACGVRTRAEELVGDIRRRVAAVQEKTAELPRRRVMVTVHRETMGSGTVKNVWIAAEDEFYSTLIAAAGGVNVSDGTAIQYPTVSAEGVMRMKPDVIIEIAPDLEKRGVDPAKAAADWNVLADVSAVRNGAVHVLTDPIVARPGPRFAAVLEILARVIHPEVDWD